MFKRIPWLDAYKFLVGAFFVNAGVSLPGPRFGADLGHGPYSDS